MLGTIATTIAASENYPGAEVMIRKSLQKFYHKKENMPHTYMGRISEVSLHRYRDGYRVLVSDVFLATGEWITDHIWIRLEVLPQTIGLNIGDTI